MKNFLHNRLWFYSWLSNLLRGVYQYLKIELVDEVEWYSIRNLKDLFITMSEKLNFAAPFLDKKGILIWIVSSDRQKFGIEITLFKHRCGFFNSQWNKKYLYVHVEYFICIIFNILNVIVYWNFGNFFNFEVDKWNFLQISNNRKFLFPANSWGDRETIPGNFFRSEAISNHKNGFWIAEQGKLVPWYWL